MPGKFDPRATRPCCLQPNLRISPTHQAFSLIEVVLAVGVISFALVGIIGLFPVAMQSALDSQRETQVAFIARSLFSELQRVDGDKAYVTITPASGNLVGASRSPITLSLEKDTNKFYYDVDGGMLATSSTNAVYVAEVVTTTDDQPLGLARVDINISVPADAPAANQKTYNFVTLINYTPSTSTPPAP